MTFNRGKSDRGRGFEPSTVFRLFDGGHKSSLMFPDPLSIFAAGIVSAFSSVPMLRPPQDNVGTACPWVGGGLSPARGLKSCVPLRSPTAIDECVQCTQWYSDSEGSAGSSPAPLPASFLPCRAHISHFKEQCSCHLHCCSKVNSFTQVCTSQRKWLWQNILLLAVLLLAHSANGFWPALVFSDGTCTQPQVDLREWLQPFPVCKCQMVF